MTTRTLLAAMLLAGAALPWGAALAQEPRTIAIQAELHETQFGLHMVPERIDARVGDTLAVEVVNRGAAMHNLVFCGDPAGHATCGDVWARTERLAANQSQTLTFVVPKAGTFDYYSDLPGQRQGGMKGQLFVQEAPGAKNESPFLPLPLALLAAAGALLVLSRRRSP